MIVGRIYLYTESSPIEVRILYDKICELYLKQNGIDSTPNPEPPMILFCDLADIAVPNAEYLKGNIFVKKETMIELAKQIPHNKEDMEKLLALRSSTMFKTIRKKVSSYMKNEMDLLVKTSEEQVNSLRLLSLEGEAMSGLRQLVAADDQNKTQQ